MVWGQTRENREWLAELGQLRKKRPDLAKSDLLTPMSFWLKESHKIFKEENLEIDFKNTLL